MQAYSYNTYNRALTTKTQIYILKYSYRITTLSVLAYCNQSKFNWKLHKFQIK